MTIKYWENLKLASKLYSYWRLSCKFNDQALRQFTNFIITRDVVE